MLTAANNIIWIASGSFNSDIGPWIGGRGGSSVALDNVLSRAGSVRFDGHDLVHGSKLNLGLGGLDSIGEGRREFSGGCVLLLGLAQRVAEAGRREGFWSRNGGWRRGVGVWRWAVGRDHASEEYGKLWKFCGGIVSERDVADLHSGENGVVVEAGRAVRVEMGVGSGVVVGGGGGITGAGRIAGIEV